MELGHASMTPIESASESGETAERWSGLMARAQAGDQNAYQTLLEEIAPSLRSLCRSYVGHDDDLEDIVQDILLTVHGIRHTYRHTRPFRPWLFTIARRRIIDWIRQRSRRQLREVESRDERDPPDERMVDSTGIEPDGAAIRDDVARQVHLAIAALPPHQREAIILLRLRGLTLEEAAETTRRSESALKVACHRALKSLHSVFNGSRRHD